MNVKLLTCLLILTLSVCFVRGQVSNETEVPEQIASEGILVEEDIIDAEISIRVPESSIQPRTRTEELSYMLNYFREIILQSNRQLY